MARDDHNAGQALGKRRDARSAPNRPIRRSQAMHDLNNALSGIIGYAELLAADIRSGSASVEDADRVVTLARQAIALTRTIE